MHTVDILLAIDEKMTRKPDSKRTEKKKKVDLVDEAELVNETDLTTEIFEDQIDSSRNKYNYCVITAIIDRLPKYLKNWTAEKDTILIFMTLNDTSCETILSLSPASNPITFPTHYIQISSSRIINDIITITLSKEHITHINGTKVNRYSFTPTTEILHTLIIEIKNKFINEENETDDTTAKKIEAAKCVERKTHKSQTKTLPNALEPSVPPPQTRTNKKTPQSNTITDLKTAHSMHHKLNANNPITTETTAPKNGEISKKKYTTNSTTPGKTKTDEELATHLSETKKQFNTFPRSGKKTPQSPRLRRFNQTDVESKNKNQEAVKTSSEGKDMDDKSIQNTKTQDEIHQSYELISTKEIAKYTTGTTKKTKISQISKEKKRSDEKMKHIKITTTIDNEPPYIALPTIRKEINTEKESSSASRHNAITHTIFAVDKTKESAIQENEQRSTQANTIETDDKTRKSATKKNEQHFPQTNLTETDDKIRKSATKKNEQHFPQTNLTETDDKIRKSATKKNEQHFPQTNLTENSYDIIEPTTKKNEQHFPQANPTENSYDTIEPTTKKNEQHFPQASPTWNGYEKEAEHIYETLSDHSTENEVNTEGNNKNASSNKSRKYSRNEKPPKSSSTDNEQNGLSEKKTNIPTPITNKTSKTLKPKKNVRSVYIGIITVLIISCCMTAACITKIILLFATRKGNNLTLTTMITILEIVLLITFEFALLSIFFFYISFQNNIEATTEQNYSTHIDEKQCHTEDTSHHDNEPHSHPVEH